MLDPLVRIAVLAGAASLLPGVGAQQRPGEPSGTGTVRGVVVADDTGEPIPGARVHAIVTPSGGDAASGDRTSHFASSDGDGRFAIAGLPAGRVTIGALKDGYYFLDRARHDGDARAPGPGPLELRDGETVDGLTIRLGRAGAIAGRVTTERGQPVTGVAIEVLRRAADDGAGRWVSEGRHTESDDRGVFRVWGLPPGDYIVGARPRFEVSGSQTASPRHDGFAHTYYPGTTAVADATPVPVGPGRDTTGITFPVVATRLASVRGRVLTDGAAARITVMVSRLDQERQGGTGAQGSRAGADGTFEVTGLTPGRYRLSAREGRDGPWGTLRRLGVIDLDVDGVDVEGVTIAMRGGSTLTGRVVHEAGEPMDGRVRVGVMPAEMDGSSVYVQPAAIRGDGTFTIAGVFGRGSIRLVTPAGELVPIGPTAGSSLFTTRVTRGDVDVTGRALDFDGRPVDVTIHVATRAR